MPPESPDREEGAEHTTGAGDTPRQQVVRSGRRDTPAEMHAPGKAKGGGADAPAMVGTSDTGEPEDIFGE